VACFSGYPQGLFFFCFVYPFALRSIDNFTKFELTPEMQSELKDLLEKVRTCPRPIRVRPPAQRGQCRWPAALTPKLQKKRGEFVTDSKLLSRMMEHQEKIEKHEDSMASMRDKLNQTRK
jgi:hypothetical protein